MAAKFSMVNTSGLFDTAAHVEASDRMQDAMEELKVKNDRQQRAAERQRAAAATTAKEQSQRLARARDHARANAAKSDDAYVRARKPNENQDEDEDDDASDSDFSDDGYGLPDAFRLGASLGKAGEEDEDEDDALLDGLDADPELERLRARRLAQLKTQFEHKQALLAKGHGELREIDQDAFLQEVTGSARVLVHFYHRDFERCKIMDMHLARLAKTHIECKFLKLNAEKAPFFVEKLAVRVLPTVIGFADGVAYPQRVVGFDGLTDEDDDDEDRADGGGAFGSRLNYRAKSSDSFPTAALARKLEDIGVITHNEADEDETSNA